MSFYRAFTPVLLFTSLLWMIHLVAYVNGGALWNLGVTARDLSSLPMILTAPLVHASWEHLVANTLPILILGTALLFGYARSSKWVIPVIWIGSGLGVWLFAREVTHLGASGLTHGLMFFVFVAGVIRKDKLSSVLAMTVFFLYGGMVMSIFPREEGISFEYHFFGALMGVLMAIILRGYDPLPVEKHYSWEDESEDDIDPVIGNEWQQLSNDDENKSSPV